MKPTSRSDNDVFLLELFMLLFVDLLAIGGNAGNGIFVLFVIKPCHVKIGRTNGWVVTDE